MAIHRLFRPTEWSLRSVLFYTIFQGIHFAIFAYGYYMQKADDRLHALNELRYSVWLSRGAALVLTVDASLLVLPMCKQCLKVLRPRMRWVHMHDSQWFHRQVAYSLLFYTCIHVGSHYVNFINVAVLKLRPVTAVQIHYTQAGGITGHIMLLCMLIQFTSAHIKIRQQSYESFWKIHHTFIVFFLALLTHGTGCFVRDTAQPYSPFAGKVFWKHCIGYQSFRWELIPLTIYLCERLYRAYLSRQSAKVLEIIRHTPKLLEVRFEKKGFEYKAGQWIYVKFPDVVADEWHPFTISSCPQDPYISVHIQQLGDFTRYLGKDHDNRRESFISKRNSYLSQKESRASNRDSYLSMNDQDIAFNQLPFEEGQEYPRMRVDGPYSSPAEDVLKNEVSIMVGAGIGVTPWIAILRAVWNLRNDPEASRKCKIKRLEFIWVCKDILHYQWLHDQIAALDQQSLELGNKVCYPTLRSRIFLTRQLDANILQGIDFAVASPKPLSPIMSVDDPRSPSTKSTTIDTSAKTSTDSTTNSTATTIAIAEVTELAEKKISDYSITPSPTTTLPTAFASETATRTNSVSATVYQTKMHHGKPDFIKELTNLTKELIDEGYTVTKAGHRKKVTAGLFYCGPGGAGGAGKAVRDACDRVSNKEVEYQFWKEYG